jgi:hypothetical protein
MTTHLPSTRQEAITLSADACLFTAAAVCLTAGMVPLALLIGPVAVWLLHNRRIDRRALIGGVVGLIAGTLAIGGLFLLALFVAGVFTANPDEPFSVPYAIVIPALVVFGGVIAALDIDSLRDLARSRRAHTRLDFGRLAATAVIVVFAVAVGLMQMANPASEVFELGLFALGGAAASAVAMATANAIVSATEQPAQAGGRSQ